MEQKSDFVQRLDRVQAGLAQIVKPSGFRQRRRTLIRIFEGDIHHVIGLQMGQYDIGSPPAPDAARLRQNFYGKFTVNIGVFVPEIFERRSIKMPRSNAITDLHCSICVRLGVIASGQDTWWALSDEYERLVDEVGSILIDIGIPFLGKFSSRDAIIEQLTSSGVKGGNICSAPLLDAAMIYFKQGRLDAAKVMLEKHLTQHRKDQGHKSHETYIQVLSQRLGLGSII